MIAWGRLQLWLSHHRYLGYNAGMLDRGNIAQTVASVLYG